MFWASLTINKIACEKTPSTLLGVFVSVFESSRPRTKSPGVVNRLGDWQLAISYPCRDKKGVLTVNDGRAVAPEGARLGMRSVVWCFQMNDE
ncbi:MAG: hypothetical protein JWP80_3406 [Pseudomonas sp.]|nr:hypothetical protein [Pseudomonas sp.]